MVTLRGDFAGFPPCVSRRTQEALTRYLLATAGRLHARVALVEHSFAKIHRIGAH